MFFPLVRAYRWTIYHLFGIDLSLQTKCELARRKKKKRERDIFEDYVESIAWKTIGCLDERKQKIMDAASEGKGSLTFGMPPQSSELNSREVHIMEDLVSHYDFLSRVYQDQFVRRILVGNDAGGHFVACAPYIKKKRLPKFTISVPQSADRSSVCIVMKIKGKPYVRFYLRNRCGSSRQSDIGSADYRWVEYIWDLKEYRE